MSMTAYIAILLYIVIIIANIIFEVAIGPVTGRTLYSYIGPVITCFLSFGFNFTR